MKNEVTSNFQSAATPLSPGSDLQVEPTIELTEDQKQYIHQLETEELKHPAKNAARVIDGLDNSI